MNYKKNPNMDMQVAEWQSAYRADSTWAGEVGTAVWIVSFCLYSFQESKDKNGRNIFKPSNILQH